MVVHRGYSSSIQRVELADYRRDAEGNLRSTVEAPAIVISWRTASALSSSSGGGFGCGYTCRLYVELAATFEPDDNTKTSETADQLEWDIRRALLELPDWCRQRMNDQDVAGIDDDPNAFTMTVDFAFAVTKTFLMS
jgi:hypothetical protein